MCVFFSKIVYGQREEASQYLNLRKKSAEILESDYFLRFLAYVFEPILMNLTEVCIEINGTLKRIKGYVFVLRKS